jgi:excisionase family DNA binding protein
MTGLVREPLRFTLVESSATDRPGQPAVEWLSTAEAASRLGITARTLYRFIDEGQLPAYRFGRVIRLRVTEVDAFIDTCRIEPGSLDHLYADPGQSSDSVSSAR